MVNWFIAIYVVGLVLAGIISLILWFVSPFLIDERYETETEAPTWKYIAYPFIWPIILVWLICTECFIALRKKFKRDPEPMSQS